MTLSNTKTAIQHDQDVLVAIADAIALIQKQTGYGSIEITLHDGRVTQIKRREKVRFEQKSNKNAI